MRKHNASKPEDIPNIGKSIASDLRSLGILMYFPIHSGSCAPAQHKLTSLATF